MRDELPEQASLTKIEGVVKSDSYKAFFPSCLCVVICVKVTPAGKIQI